MGSGSDLGQPFSQFLIRVGQLMLTNQHRYLAGFGIFHPRDKRAVMSWR